MKENTPSQEALFPEIPLPQTVIHYCEQFGIQHIVISAGSRNAPLTNGFVENNYFKTYSVVDERAAAFFGLGMAQQLQQTPSYLFSVLPLTLQVLSTPLLRSRH